MPIGEKLNNIIKCISENEGVAAVGISGQLEPFPKPGEGDIDVFIYCSEFPDEAIRKEQLTSQGADEAKTAISNEPVWGLMDYCTIEKVDTFLMYFNTEEVLSDTKDIMEGKHLWKSDSGYYPVGRLAMLSGINILYDRNNFLGGIKKTLEVYPKELKGKMLAYHTGRMYDDEDFARAVSRKDIFFYHGVLDTAMEHFLMALFALNETYFPSRKRTGQYVESFPLKPERCIERLADIIKHGAVPESIEDSGRAYKKLCEDLIRLV